MKPLYYLFIIAFILMISCNSKPEEKVATPAIKTEKPAMLPIELSGTTYFFGPHFNEKNCEALGECDCCTLNFLFIDNENFVMVCPCESDESLMRGTYKILDNKVVLNYDTLQVDRDYSWEADADTTQTLKPEYVITNKKYNVSTLTLEPSYCNGKLYFKIKADGEITYGTIDTQYSLNERVQQLKDEGVWDEIQQ